MLNLGYQSYQSGIETERTLGDTRRDDHYQSYQSGIETYSRAMLLPKTMSTNRTNLELKQRNSKYYSLFLLTTNRTNLELKRQYTLERHQYLYSTNRTNLELKLILSISGNAAFKLPIAPIWN